MVKKNKGGSTSRRALAQRARQGMAESERRRQHAAMRRVMAVLGDIDLDYAHLILFGCLRSVEVAMEEQGMSVPKNYVEHRVSEKRQDMNKDYVPCRRCEYCVVVDEDSMGKIGECKAFMYRDGSPFLCCGDDGCSRGYLKEMYL